jgi:hypothetical protein
VASRRPDLSGADVLLRDEGERDALRDRHTEWSRITLGGTSGRFRGNVSVSYEDPRTRSAADADGACSFTQRPGRLPRWASVLIR